MPAAIANLLSSGAPVRSANPRLSGSLPDRLAIHEEKPELAVLAAGSLLEFTLFTTKFSMPVGRLEYYWLEPLAFDEFLEGAGEVAAGKYWAGWDLEQAFSASAHERLLLRLREFLVVGGMPEAVQAYIDSGGHGLPL